MKRLKNNTDNDISIQFKGIRYSLPGNSSKVFEDDVANYWKNNIHQFLTLQEVGDVKPEMGEPVKVVAPMDVAMATIEEPKKKGGRPKKVKEPEPTVFVPGEE